MDMPLVQCGDDRSGGGPLAATASRERELLALLLGLSQQLRRGATLEDLLQQIAAAALDLSEAESASVMLFDIERGELFCEASAGMPADESRSITFRVGEGIAGWVVEHGEALVVDDCEVDERFKSIPGQKTRIRSLCCVPMFSREGVIGVLTIGASEPGRFDEQDRELMLYLATVIAKDIENARLYQQAITDPLTGAYNRQYLCERLPTELERHRRYDQPMSLIILDIDLFKQVNDLYGHSAGDAVLREVGSRLIGTSRDVDFVVRYGGEEFLLVLPSTDLTGAQQLAGRVHKSIVTRPFSVPDGEPVWITISAGVAELCPRDTDAASLIARADARLYQAKAAGRNRIF